MSEVALRMDHVHKRFRRGEMYNSLRDLIPALTGRILGRKSTISNPKREFWALQDVSFEVMKGEAFGIIGHNGAGKSTILKILSRIMPPTKGRMIVNGRLSALIEVTAGFHHDLTGRENIYLNGTIMGMTKREIDAKFDAIVDFSGLEDFIDTPAKRYSSGMFARLGFSVAAHVDPEVLIVDEVLSVGDFVFQQKCIARMMEIMRSGTTVLFVSHNLGAVAELCQRGLLLDHGRVVTIGETSQVIGRYMENVRNTMRASADTSDAKPIRVTRVSLLRGQEPCVHFESEERARIEIEAVANATCKKVAVAIYLTDETHHSVFDTSTERLGNPPYDFAPGDKLKCSIELDLNMAYGTYYLSVVLYRYDIDTMLDAWEPAATFFVGTKLKGVRGVINCKPVVTYQAVERSPTTPVAS